jgi:hypothetical protein
MKPGIVVILDFEGKVELIDAEGYSSGQVSKGDKVETVVYITTGPGARADIAFSNGLLMQIQENSRFTVADFAHEPYEFVFSNGVTLDARDVDKFGDEKAVLTNLDASEEAWNEMEVEPVTANSEFILHYGTLIGETKKLQPGSRLDIITPIGTAGIRGTIWRLTIIPAGDGSFRGTLDVSRGNVVFTNTNGTRTLNVATGFSMAIEARTAANGDVNITGVSTSQMTQERVNLLNSTVRNVEAVQTFFTAVQGTPEILARVESVTGKTPPGTTQPGAGDSAPGPQPQPPGNIADPTQGATGGVLDRPVPTPVPTVTPAPTPTPRPTPFPTPTPVPTSTPRPSSK